MKKLSRFKVKKETAGLILPSGSNTIIYDTTYQHSFAEDTSRGMVGSLAELELSGNIFSVR